MSIENMSIENKVDRIKLEVLDENTKEPKITIDVPTYFPIDTERLWKVLLKELTKQEKEFKERSES